MEILLLKHPKGFLYPADELEAEKIAKVRAGVLVRAEVKQVRNAMFHRKFFALLRVGFDAFEVPAGTEYKGFPVQKDFEQFREDVIIAAGFFTVSYRINGDARVKAKSISFARMKPEDFERLYSQVANVLLQKVLAHYQNRANLDNVVNQMLGFV
jgi:hypothetical protein